MIRRVIGGVGIIAAILAVSQEAGSHSQRGASHGSHGVPRPSAVDREALQEDIAQLRHATARFHRLAVALDEGYTPFGDCFIDPAAGGMGFHYANDELIQDPEVDPLHPELLLYEKQPDGTLKLVAVEYITFQAAWHAAGHRRPPSLFGQPFHLNTTLLSEPFYLLHAWPWKHNPNGRFHDWNPRVSCP